MSRAEDGATAHHAGVAAEDGVARRYEAAGYTVAARRWRSAAGEIDLIVRRAGVVVFVEVKRSATLDAAALRLGPRQVARLLQAAEMYLGAEPGGTDSETRFDVALVDGRGGVRVIENALMP